MRGLKSCSALLRIFVKSRISYEVRGLKSFRCIEHLKNASRRISYEVRGLKYDKDLTDEDEEKRRISYEVRGLKYVTGDNHIL